MRLTTRCFAAINASSWAIRCSSTYWPIWCVIAASFFISSALGGAAGVLFGVAFNNVAPDMGRSVELKGLAVIILGESLERVSGGGQLMTYWRAGFPAPEACSRVHPERPGLLLVKAKHADTKAAAEKGLKEPFTLPRRQTGSTDVQDDDKPLDPSGKAEKEAYRPSDPQR